MPTLYVGGSGAADSPSNGTSIAPYATIAYALSQVNRASGETILSIRNGTYREAITLTSSRSSNKIIFRAENKSGVIMSAADVYSSWTYDSSNARYYTTWSLDLGLASYPGSPGAWGGIYTPGTYARQKHVLTITNIGTGVQTMYLPVTALGSLTAGTFYADESGNRIYLKPATGSGHDPTQTGSYRVEISTREHIATFSECSNIEFDGIRFEGGCHDISEGSVQFTNCESITLENCDIFYASSYGLKLQYTQTVTVSNMRVGYCGWVGIKGDYIDDTLLEYIDVGYCAWRCTQDGGRTWDSGNIKLFYCPRTITRYIFAHDSYAGGGLWYDYPSNGSSIANCYFRDNFSWGVFIEAQRQGLFGFTSSASPVTVADTYFYGNKKWSSSSDTHYLNSGMTIISDNAYVSNCTFHQTSAGLTELQLVSDPGNRTIGVGSWGGTQSNADWTSASSVQADYRDAVITGSTFYSTQTGKLLMTHRHGSGVAATHTMTNCAHWNPNDTTVYNTAAYSDITFASMQATLGTTSGNTFASISAPTPPADPVYPGYSGVIGNPLVAEAGENRTVYATESSNTTAYIYLSADGSSETATTYTWKDAGNNTLATTKYALITRTVGTHVLTLTVGDGTNTATDTVTYTVQAPPATVGETPYADDVLALSPLQFLRMNLAAGQTALDDLSSNNRDGVYIGFDAGEYRLAVPPNDQQSDAYKVSYLYPASPSPNVYNVYSAGLASAITPASFAISFFMRVAVTGDWTDNTARTYCYLKDTNNYGVRVLKNSSNVMQVEVVTASGTNTLNVTPTPADKSWYHWLLVFDGTANTCTVYFDNVSKGTVAYATDFGAFTVMTLGGEGTSNPANPFSGYITDWVIRNGAPDSSARATLATKQIGVLNPTSVSAGGDQALASGERAFLDGTGTPASAQIVSWVWRNGGTVIAEGQNTSAIFNSNTTVALTVIAADGGTATDSMAVTVTGAGSSFSSSASAALSESALVMAASAGSNRTVYATEAGSTASVQLNGALSFSDRGDVTVTWTNESAAEVGTGFYPLITGLAADTHTFTASVTDGTVTGADTVDITVTAVPSSDPYPYRTDVLADVANVIQLLPLDEASGSTADDKSSQANDGAYVNLGVSDYRATAGACDSLSAPLIDASNNTVNLYSAGFASDFNGASGAMGIWFKARVSGVWTDNTQRVIAEIRGTTGFNKLVIRKQTNNNMEIEATTGSGTQVIAWTNPNNTNWNYVLLEWDTTGNRVQVWENNVSKGTQVYPSSIGALNTARVTYGAESSSSPTKVWDGYLQYGMIKTGLTTSGERSTLATAQNPAAITNPTANAGTDITAPANERVFFDGSGSTAGGGASLVDYKWVVTASVGGGIANGTLIAEGVSGSYVFTTPDTYTVTLTTTQNDGGQDTDTLTVTINPEQVALESFDTVFLEDSASLAAPFSRTDSAAQTDAANVAAAFTRTDSATQTETKSIAAAFTRTDSAAESEAASIAAAASRTDTFTESESGSVAAAFTRADSAVESESASFAATSSRADTLSESESASVGAAFSRTDSAAENEAASVAAASTRTDALTESESATVGAAFSRTDSVTETETIGGVAITGITDSGAVTETAQTAISALPGDSIGASEQASVAVAISASDTFTVSETATVDIDWVVSDTFTLSETAAAVAALATSDSATLTDVASLNDDVNRVASELGTITESANIGAVVAATDDLTTGEVAQVGAVFSLTDTLTGSDSAQVAVAMSASDTFTLADSAVLTQDNDNAESSSDAIGATESASIAAVLSAADTFTMSMVAVVTVTSDDPAGVVSVRMREGDSVTVRARVGDSVSVRIRA